MAGKYWLSMEFIGFKISNLNLINVFKYFGLFR
jgi:hypothetical protein